MDLTFAADPLASLRLLYRKAYLSSFEHEANDGVQTLQSAWREQLSQLAPIDASVLEQMMIEERHRVEDARVLAELLLPQLRSVPSPEIRTDLYRPATAPERPPAAAPAAVADCSGSATPAVADLLDAMLRQDSARAKRNPHAA